MRTQVMTRSEAAPWLEFEALDGRGPQKITIESFPFLIGRSRTADLQLETTRVSREHAVIEREGDEYRVRDLSSTNGTFVNSRRVPESELHDGDIVAIADIELVFCTGRDESSSVTVTQMMGDQPAQHAESTVDVIRAVRRLHTAVTRRDLKVLYRPIVELRSGEVFGYTAVDPESSADPRWSICPPWLAKADCRMTERRRELWSMLAAEQLAQVPGSMHLFLPLLGAEIGTHLRMEFLTRLALLLGREHRLVVEFPDSAVGDLVHLRQLCDEARGCELQIAFEGTAATEARDGAARVPWAKLPKAAILGRLGRNDSRSRTGNRGSRDETQCVATGLTTASEADACGEWGCRYGEGPLFGEAVPLEQLRGSEPRNQHKR